MRMMLFSTIFAMAALGSAGAQNAAEIRFTFTRQSGFASNQFALWIEDSGGAHVRTLYATRFTAAGGWEKRPNSLPQWVKQSALSRMPKARVDALTGPTPRTGTVTYNWDGKDQNGAALPPGEYRICLEATLRDENRVLYTADISLGSGDFRTAEVKTQYAGSGTAERGMISGVTVRFRAVQ